ncbi:sugar ABC transporter permease [Sphaerisporangium krabiense]|uniref:Cellobiose transport system permease protein n=1 Tax=Sphaerisporangium krabiense TaxID=763782 RepID=A0A7W8Z919_9ACTN|nr:carbohydrate ABC transporter permease [Sphaerisporangium krabiense]MBB5629729.1 cellobiose transport system permease protein [Sphaerisporangium krabiense]GII63829.1 sugar ABC transporter permease [Sphaerisporangium krabiense]
MSAITSPAAGTRDRRDPFRATPLTKIGLGVTLVLSIFPIYWMIIIASRTNSDAVDVPPPLLPGGNLGENVRRVLATEDAHFLAGLLNSLVVTSAVTVSVVVISTFAGFAFARLRFRGRNLLLGSILLTMMVPLQQMGVVPLYQLMVELGWVGSLKAVILPYLLNGFGVFMMTQYTEQAVPEELVEAARVDGASTLRVWWNVILPAVRPGMAVLALQTFMLNWNEFMWPLIVLTPENPTVQVSISFLTAAHSTDYVLIFTGTALSVLPLVVVFLAFGRQIVGGLMEGAVKA